MSKRQIVFALVLGSVIGLATMYAYIVLAMNYILRID